MSAMEEYRGAREYVTGGTHWVQKTFADDVIAELQAERDKWEWVATHEGHHIAGEWYIDSRCHEELEFLDHEHEAKEETT